jgi:hypothetical protein
VPRGILASQHLRQRGRMLRHSTTTQRSIA